MFNEDTASKLPKPRLREESSSPDWISYEGILETYFETGMEYLGLILYRDGFLIPNPKYDPSIARYPHNIKEFKTHEGMMYLIAGDVLEIIGKSGRVSRRYFMARDHAFAEQDGYRLSFYPQGFSRKEWLGLFLSENKRARLWRNKSLS